MRTKTKIILGVSLLALCVFGSVSALVAFRLRYHVFNVPTGAMAPGIRGEHCEFTCGNCGCEYAVGYSRGPLGRPKDVATRPICPLCFSEEVTNPKPKLRKGDRVLTSMFLGAAPSPKRWEVVVFDYPKDPNERYISRLVGLPGETVELRGGDVTINGHMVRKSDLAQRALWMPVYDSGYWGRAAASHPQWQPESPGVGKWSYTAMPMKVTPPNKGFSFLAYHHRGKGGRPGPITDFYGYDALVRPRHGGGAISRQDGENEVTDLQLVADLQLEKPGAVRLVLRACDDTFEFTVPGAGMGESVRITHNGTEVALGPKDVLAAGQGVRVQAANIDQKLILKVDGRRVIDLNADGQLDERDDVTYVPSVPPDKWQGNPSDRTSLKIGVSGSPATIHRLRINRDVHYTNPKGHGMSGPMFGTEGYPMTLAADEYFVLGDNSPRSYDSRFWGAVPRANLVGELPLERLRAPAAP